jgi:glycosyltransferase involved in cell wall biosynthesis
MTQPQTQQHGNTSRPLRLALVSCGLGNVHRGFEVSTARWYEALKKHPGLDVKLFTGGFYKGGHFVPNIPRDWAMASPLAMFKPFNRRRYWEFCYGVEMISFGLFYWPYLVHFRPDVVWTKEVPFGYFLPIYRQMYGLDFQTVFANGGAFRPQTYKDFDFIQHLTSESFDEALNFGIAREKMRTLTNIIPFHQPDQSRAQIRQSLGYSDEDFVVMTVSALNLYHKRLDYVINEIAAMNDPRVKLLLCGHPDAETDVLKELAKKRLGSRAKFKTLSEQEVHRAMKGADAFVMASTYECLGNSMAEAVLAGLPLILHSTVASRYMFGTESEWLQDLTQPGMLAQRLREFQNTTAFASKIIEVQPHINDLFGADRQVERFYDMIKTLHSSGKRAPHSVPMEFGSTGHNV